MGRKPNKQLSREANTGVMGRTSESKETGTNYANYKLKPIPKSHRDFNRVLAFLNKAVEESEKDPTKYRGVSGLHVKAFEQLMFYAFREPVEDISMVKCTKCGKTHLIECGYCNETHEIKIPSATHEKNSLAALLKLSDKLAPNLAAVTQDVNINVFVSNIAEWGVKVISKYVPGDKQAIETQALNQVLTNAIEAEYSEVANG